MEKTIYAVQLTELRVKAYRLTTDSKVYCAGSGMPQLAQRE